MKGIAFYEVAAQIIPILLLVLVIEIRVLQYLIERSSRLIAAIGLALIALGEIRALLVLQTEHQWHVADSIFVWDALALEVGLIAGVLAGTQSRGRD